MVEEETLERIAQLRRYIQRLEDELMEAGQKGSRRLIRELHNSYMELKKLDR